MVASGICEYLVSHGKTGAFGRFAARLPFTGERGQRVVVQSRRGLELGSILCQSTAKHALFLDSTPVGELLRPATSADEALAARLERLGQQLYEEGGHLAAELALPVAILDVEVLLDGQQAIVQHLSPPDCDLTALVEELQRRHALAILLESLTAALPIEEETTHGGCGEPGCGHASGSGCSSCGSGGCSSCGSGQVDMRAYFGHLRTRMEDRRKPLL